MGNRISLGTYEFGIRAINTIKVLREVCSQRLIGLSLKNNKSIFPWTALILARGPTPFRQCFHNATKRAHLLLTHLRTG